MTDSLPASVPPTEPDSATDSAACDGYEWRGDVPWKCKLPPGHKTPDGTFLGRSCWGSSEYRVLDGRDRIVLDRLLSEAEALGVRDAHERSNPKAGPYRVEVRGPVIGWNVL
jgi:hypothetical protein